MPSTRSTAAVVSPKSSTWELFAKGVSDIRSLVSCRICTRLMYEPYTTRCGHTFCYGCLSKWLNHGERKRQCPDCRAKVKEEPSPDYTIRNIVHVLLSDSSFLDDGDTAETLQEEQSQEAKALETDRQIENSKGLFQGLFKNRYHDAIHDQSDGVMRCPSCNWEVEGFFCDRCDLDFDGDSLADFSDYSYSSDLDLHGSDGDDASDEPNEDDEAFLDNENDRESHSSSHYPWNDERNTDMNPRDDEGSVDLYDALGTYHSPYDLDSDSDGLAGYASPTGHNPATASEVSLGTSPGIGSSSSEDSNSESGSNADGGLGDSGTDSPDETDEEPIPQRTRARSRAQATRSTQADSQRSNGRPRPTTVVDLISPDISSTRHRRPAPRTASSTTNNNNSSTGSATSTIRASRANSAATTNTNTTTTTTSSSSNNNESDSETPIPIRPRKRERIVLSDSEDDDASASVQRQPQPRRRRITRDSSRDDSTTAPQRNIHPLAQNSSRNSPASFDHPPRHDHEPLVRLVFPPLRDRSARQRTGAGLMPNPRTSASIPARRGGLRGGVRGESRTVLNE